jgi:hypothetical protein
VAYRRLFKVVTLEHQRPFVREANGQFPSKKYQVR